MPIEIKSLAQFESFFQDEIKKKVAIFFYMPKSEPCQLMAQMFEALEPSYPDITFLQLCADTDDSSIEMILQAFQISFVPFVSFLYGSKVVSRLEGANPKTLQSKIETFNQQNCQDDANGTSEGQSNGNTNGVSDSSPELDYHEPLKQKLTRLTQSSPIMLFMKGSPTEPQCGFSRQIVGLLKDLKIEFDSFDILTDNEVRQGLKDFSDWPTFPQLYIKGEFVGGLDIVKSMVKDGSLMEMI